MGYLFISTLVLADDMKEYIHPVYVLLDVGLDVRGFLHPFLCLAVQTLASILCFELAHSHITNA